jgi:von Willebrand factor type A domain
MSRPIRERIHLGLALAGLACASSWVSALGCSSGGPKGTSLIDAQGCDPAVDARCGSAGAVCQSDAQCASGSCSAGACVSAGPEGSAGASGGANDDYFSELDLKYERPAEDPTCVDLDVDFQRITPTVVLLLDQSGSMDQNFENGRDRWQTLRETLTNPATSLLQRLDTSVRFGMTLYTSDGGFGDTPGSPRICPKLQGESIRLGNFGAMSSFLNQKNGGGQYIIGPAGDTPTAESVQAVVRTLRAYEEEGPKSIILATDGDPDTCDDPDANDSDASKALSVAAVRAAFDAGIPTHIISVGNQVTASHLQALAVAGAGGDQTAQAYTALDTSALQAAFEAIIGSVRTCDFTLEGRVTASNAARGKVVLDGQALSYGDANGWEMPDEQTVRLKGSACQQVQADAGAISMQFPCDAIIIIPR